MAISVGTGSRGWFARYGCHALKERKNSHETETNSYTKTKIASAVLSVITVALIIGQTSTVPPSTGILHKHNLKHKRYDHIIIADEGKWITGVGPTPNKRQPPLFWHDIYIYTQKQYMEVTNAICEQQWQTAHPTHEPEQIIKNMKQYNLSL